MNVTCMFECCRAGSAFEEVWRRGDVLRECVRLHQRFVAAESLLSYQGFALDHRFAQGFALASASRLARELRTSR
jgi:hypothetical protein